LSRIYRIHDAGGERQIGEQDLPLAVGGTSAGGIAIPGLPAAALVAHIGLDAGHAFIQPVQTDVWLFHNHEHLTSSKWLKSGDLVEVGDSLLCWLVQGDQVNISVQERSEAPQLIPPVSPLPATSRELPEVPHSPTPSPVHTTRKRVAAGVFVLLLLAVVFVLLATPISIQISPEPESYTLSGFPPAVPIGRRQLILPGSYTITAQRTGYRRLEQTIEVAAGGFQQFRLQLDELPGRVGFKLQPEVPFNLFVNDVEVATDADRFAEIPAGTHRLRIETARYLSIEETLSVAGKGQEQLLSYRLQPAWANVHLDSLPAGANVQVDGKTIGATPLQVELLQGEYDLVLTHEKYRALSFPLQVLAGKELVPGKFLLQPAAGRLALDSDPAGANVSVDSVFKGTTPLTLTLDSGVEQTLRLTKLGYQQFERQISLAADEEQSLDVQLRPQYGIVFVTARPADAMLRVDGRDAGRATQRLQLTTRSHTLTFSKSGYVSKKVRVTPRSGTSQNLDVILVKKARAEKRSVATPGTSTTPAGQQLRLVQPQGSFSMGASRREAGRRANESARRVQLTRPFFLAEREVTNAEYRKFDPAHNSGSAEGVSLDGASQPVVNISWDAAARYCNWLSVRAGLPPAYTEVNGRMRQATPITTGYRLPGEAEWSYVARRHTQQSEQRYPWSGSFPPTRVVGNFADASIGDTLANTVKDYNDGYRVTAPVGSFAARPKGFYDLGGNVAEWMHDYYAVYPGEADRLVTDPLGPATGSHHVVRDSSWRLGTITELRLSYRDYSRVARPDLGFRIARYAE